MKTYSPQRHRDTEKSKPVWSRVVHACPVSILFALACLLRAVRPELVEGLPFDKLRANGIISKRTVLRPVLFFSVSLCLCGSGFAASSLPDLPGRLFYTPAQRAQLETARLHSVTPGAHLSQAPSPDSAPAPLRFDGVMTRSDGKSTRWVDGKAQLGASSVTGLKPGQIRADGKVYEPYQVLRPNQAETSEMESTP